MTPNPPPSVDGFSDLVRIGRGGFSTVYSAVQAGIERRVAIKVLDQGSSDATRFERECRTLGSLSGVPGIVPVLQAAFTTSGQPCIVMQLMDGGSLADRIRTTGALDPADVIAHGVTLATALQRAHGATVFHRDIKPENILFHDGQAAIADFGIALDAGVESRSQTMESISPPHAPPERFVEGGSHPVLGDVYSLSSTLYTALAGRPPFGTAADGGLAGLISRVTRDPLPPIDRVEITPELWRVLAIATSKEPSGRYPSMAEFASALLAVGRSDHTVHRSPSSATIIRQGVPSVLPDPIAASHDPSHQGAAPLRWTHVGADGSLAQPPFDATPPPPRSRSLTALWGATAVMSVLSVAGLAFLLSGGLDRGEATARPTAASVVPSVSADPTMPTTSTTTAVTIASPVGQGPTAVGAPQPTSPPTMSAPPTSLPVSEATTAVDQYLVAASGGDVEEFARRWSYPIESHYGNEAVGEPTLRDSARRYWARFISLEFARSGPTSVRSSARGWETTTDYRAVLVNDDGTTSCMDNRIRLGFDRSWRLRTAAEEQLADC